MKKIGQHKDTLIVHKGYDDNETSRKSSLFHCIRHRLFHFNTAIQGKRRFAGIEDGDIYSRLGNPTVRVLEERMTALENGGGALAFGSGMAAVSSLLVHLTKTGDHTIMFPWNLWMHVRSSEDDAAKIQYYT